MDFDSEVLVEVEIDTLLVEVDVDKLDVELDVLVDFEVDALLEVLVLALE